MYVYFFVRNSTREILRAWKFLESPKLLCSWNGLVFSTTKCFCSRNWNVHKQNHHVWTAFLQIHSQNQYKVLAEKSSGRSLCYTDQIPTSLPLVQRISKKKLSVEHQVMVLHNSPAILGLFGCPFFATCWSPESDESCSKGLKIRCCASAEIPQPGPSWADWRKDS